MYNDLREFFFLSVRSSQVNLARLCDDRFANPP